MAIDMVLGPMFFPIHKQCTLPHSTLPRCFSSSHSPHTLMISKRVLLAVTVATVAIAMTLNTATTSPVATTLAPLPDGPLDLSLPEFRFLKPRDAARGPCPFLNTAANHGLLPRDGKHITITRLDQALAKMGLPSVFKSLLIKGAKSVFAKNNIDEQDFALTQLNPPRMFEHDLSLTRFDQYGPHLGHQTPEPELVEGMLSLAYNRTYSDDEEPYLTAMNIVHWRQLRVKQEKSLNHPIQFDMRAQFASAGECAMLVHILGRHGKISVDTAKSILLEERFPEEWKPATENGFTLMAKLTGAITECAGGYYLPQGLVTRLGGEQGWCTHGCPLGSHDDAENTSSDVEH